MDLIRQMGQFLAQALGKGKNQQQESSMQLQRASMQLVGIDLDAAEQLSMRSLRMLFLNREGLDVARCMVLGMLLNQRAETLEASPRKDELQQKAKILLLDAANAADAPLPVETLTTLEGLTSPDERPEHVQEWLDGINLDPGA